MNFNPANVPVTEPGGRHRPHSALVPGASGTSLDPSTSSGLCWPLIREMAKYAAAAYVSHTVCDPFTDAEALLTELPDDNCLIIAFRGSREPRDFVQDAKFDMRLLMWRGFSQGSTESRPTTLPRVHEGFWRIFKGSKTTS